jgi:DNA polymerase III delta prime subunit
MKNKLFTEIFAPKTVDQMILPDRIKSTFTDGTVGGNYLFHSGPGMGKSQLAKILAKNHPYKYINASLEGRIDVLRTEITDFCTEVQITEHPMGTMKVVILDEIDGVSASFFDALRGFMDSFQGNTRFVATCNVFAKIPDPIKSRFDCFNFGFKNDDEEKQMFALYKGRMAYIVKGLKIEADDEAITALCTTNFPDYRGTLQTLQRLHRSGHKVLTSAMVLEASYEFIDLYKLILSGGEPKDIHRILMGDYANKATDVLQSLDRPFIKWLVENHIQAVYMIPHIAITVAKYQFMCPTMVDPALAMKACVFELMELAKKKQ